MHHPCTAFTGFGPFFLPKRVTHCFLAELVRCSCAAVVSASSTDTNTLGACWGACCVERSCACCTPALQTHTVTAATAGRRELCQHSIIACSSVEAESGRIADTSHVAAARCTCCSQQRVTWQLERYQPNFPTRLYRQYKVGFEGVKAGHNQRPGPHLLPASVRVCAARVAICPACCPWFFSSIDITRPKFTLSCSSRSGGVARHAANSRSSSRSS